MQHFPFTRRGMIAVATALALAGAGLMPARASSSGPPSDASDVRLIMVEQPGCAYCAAWDDEIAPAYGKTEEGRFAPLERADLHIGPPEGVEYDRKVRFTPTFVLVQDGEEIARMEGYVGQDFFWPLYRAMLERNTAFEPGAE